jgi:ABC-type transport system substrate-binding protein
MPFTLTKESAGGVELALKTTSPPFDDLNVRRAAFLALDPWSTIRDVWGGMAYVSPGFPVVGPDWLLEDDELREYFSDSQTARELLQGAQVPIPLPVSIKVGDFGEAYVAHGQRIADEMRLVGFDPTLEVVNRRDFGEQVWLGGDYEMFVGPVAPVTSPNGYLLPVLHSQGQWNTAGYRDTELDALIERQAQEFDPATRRELVREIQRKVYSNAYRFMPATRISIWAWQPRVQNFHPNFAGYEYSHWSRVWIR